MQKTRKPLSLLLTLCMILSLFAGLTFTASADEGQTLQVNVEQTATLEDGETGGNETTGGESGGETHVHEYVATNDENGTTHTWKCSCGAERPNEGDKIGTETVTAFENGKRYIIVSNSRTEALSSKDYGTTAAGPNYRAGVAYTAGEKTDDIVWTYENGYLKNGGAYLTNDGSSSVAFLTMSETATTMWEITSDMYLKSSTGNYLTNTAATMMGCAATTDSTSYVHATTVNVYEVGAGSPTEAHTFVNGVCSACEYQCEHSEKTALAAVAATCTTSGLTAGEKCSTCGTITTEQTVTEALGHNYVDGVCSRCNEKQPTTPIYIIEEVSALSDGGLYVITNSDGKKAMSYLDGTASTARKAVDIKITGNVISAGEGVDMSDLLWTTEANTANTETYYLKSSVGSYLYMSSGKLMIYEADYKKNASVWNYGVFGANRLAVAAATNYPVGIYSTGFKGLGVYGTSADDLTLHIYSVTTCKHENKTSEVTVEATCTADGSYSFHCDDCNKDITTVYPALGHVQGEMKNETTTYWEYECTRCHETYQVMKDARLGIMQLSGVTVSFSTDGAYEWAYDADNNRIQSTNYHVGSSNSVTTITFTADKAFTLSFDYAVSSESNSDYLTLTLDGKETSTKISGKNDVMLTFSYPETELAAGTHTLKLDYKKDSSLDKGEDRAYLSNLKALQVCEHEPGDAEVTIVAPTCTEQGYRTYTCSKCDVTVKDNFTNPLGHDYDQYENLWDGTHSFTCKREGCSGGTEAHTYEDGVCSKCGVLQPITIGTGTSTSSSVPYNNAVYNAATQMIYTASEIGSAGTISSIAFQVAAAGELATETVKIYMGNTKAEKYEYYSPVGLTTADGLKLVYEGKPTLGKAVGWEELKLDTPFFYNGLDNLVIAVVRASATNASSLKYAYTSTTNYTTIYRGNNVVSSKNNYINIDSGTVYNYGQKTRPNVQLRITEHVHQWDDGTPVPATCLTDGYTLVTCKDSTCGVSKKINTVPAPGHNYGEGKFCTVCGSKKIEAYADLFYAIEPYFDLSATESVAGKWTVSTLNDEAVAKSTGTNTIKLTAHDDGTLTINAAIKLYSSSQPTYSYINVTVKDSEGATVSTTKISTDSTDPVFQTVNVDVKADQTVELYCYWYSQNYFQYLRAFSFTPDCVHKHAEDDAGTVTAPTCLVRGYTTYTCTECKKTYRTNYTDALGHAYVPVKVEPTCTKTGLVTETCTRCNDVIETVLPANGHQFENGYCTVCHEKAASYTEIGTGTTKISTTPYGQYKYYSSQLLYTVDKIGSGGTITKIAFNVLGATSVTADNLKIYMGHKSATSFSSKTDFVAKNDLTPVYDHQNVTFGDKTGWEERVLDTPFDYNGVDSLVIVITVKKAGTSYDTYYAYTSTGSSELHAYSDTLTEATYDNIEAYASTGNYLPNIQITFKLEASAHPGTLTAVALTGNCVEGGVKAHWECGTCHRLFSDEQGLNETTLADLTLPAGGTHDYGEDGVCTVCGTVKPVAKIGETTYASLAEAIAAAESGATVTLLDDIALESKITISKSLTLDLGGHTLTGVESEANKEIGALTINAGTVELKNGTIAGRVSVYDAANVTVAKDLTITNRSVYDATAYGIVVWGDGTFGTEGCQTPTLNFYGKINVTGNALGISTNGGDKSAPVVNIYDGAEITADTDGIGIYLPAGKLTVEGGSVTGATAIYFKSTDMTISGGTFRGIGAAVEYDYYGNGANATGDAIVIDNCSYPNGIGTVAVTGGTFNSTNAKPVASYKGNGQETALTGFVSGGTFDKAIEDALCASGFECVQNEDGTFGVQELSAVAFKLEASEIEDGKIVVKVIAARELQFSVMELYLRCSYGDATLESITSDYVDAYSVNTATGYAGLYTGTASDVTVAKDTVLAAYTYAVEGTDFRFRLSTGDCYSVDEEGTENELPWSDDYANYEGEDKPAEMPSTTVGNPGEDPTGFTVTVEDKNSGATVTGLDGLKFGSTTFTVMNDKACVVLVKTGDTYERLTATKVEGEENTYSFTIKVTEATTIVVAIKGDVNGNGKIDSADVAQIKATSLSKMELIGELAFIADLNGNGKIDSADAIQIKAVSLNRLVLAW